MKKHLLTPILGLTPLFMITFGVLAYLFRANPQWDIHMSALFYTPEGGFFLEKTIWAQFVYKGVYYATTITIVALVIMLAFSYRKKSHTVARISRKSLIFALVVMIIGPGLTVNELLKNNIGRARPAQTTLFGGELQFTPAFTPSNQCDGNCSFVSGHASFGYYWVVLGLVATSAFVRWRYFLIAFAMGSGIGFVRIVQGRHFLSDVIFSFFFVYSVAAVIHWVMYSRKR